MKVKVTEIKYYQLKKYLNKIGPYLQDINNLKTSKTWKIQLTIAINFTCSKDNNEESVMNSKSDNKEIMINDKADKVIEKLFKSLLNRDQNNLEKLLKGTQFVFAYVHLLYYKYHKINSRRGGSYTDSPDCIKSKKATINHINKKDKRFQYDVTVVLNHEEVKKDPQRTTKIKPFIINITQKR